MNLLKSNGTVIVNGFLLTELLKYNVLRKRNRTHKHIFERLKL